MNRSTESAWRRRTLRLIALVALVAITLGLSGCNKLKARDRLNKGVQAYKNARYEEAINRFKEASELDPDLHVAKLYLATAYAQQVVPGIDSEENNRMAQAAIDEYQKVVDANVDQEQKVTGLKGIAALLRAEKVRPSQGVPPQSAGDRPQRSGDLLLHRRDRLDPDLHPADGRARQDRLEAR
jgi:tetratricopeptide (TPR) repeat protein